MSNNVQYLVLYHYKHLKKNNLTYFKFRLVLIFSILQLTISAQNNALFGLLRTPNPPTVYLGKLDLGTSTFNQISPSSLATSYNLTGAALDPNTGSYFFVGNESLLSVNLLDGLTLAQNPLTNPISPSYFDNFRFNTSDSSLYGLARRFIQGSGIGQGYGELFLSTIDPNTGVITQISPQSVGESYALQGSAIDPHQMVYYYATGDQLIGLDMYTGLVYSAPNLSFPEGGLYFDNFTYNCADTTIYGLIRVSTTPPLTVHFGRVNPQTGVVTRISQQALDYSTFTLNGSSTIDPYTGTYYYVSSLAQGGYGVIGLSVQTGNVVSVNPIPANGTTPNYFDMMRHPSDCFDAEATRVNPNSGSVGFTNLEKQQIKVSPNPFDEQINIVSAERIKTLVLRDALGKVYLETAPAAFELQLQTSTLTSGMYFLELHTAMGVELLKVVK
ncbi:MAG: hypothetical protein RL207_474 [Bacteroidota bacterium]